MKVILAKAGGALVPVDQQGVELLASLKTGQGVTVELKRARNVKFHRKYFALLNLAFDAWEPEYCEYRGEPISKNFDRFREDLTILSGHYIATITLRNEVRVVAKSISFASMGEDEFDKLYNATVNVILARILKNYTRDDLDRVIDQLLSFT